MTETQDLVLALGNVVLALLLLFSEWLGLSNCKSNSIVQFFKNYYVCGREETPQPSLPVIVPVVKKVRFTDDSQEQL